MKRKRITIIIFSILIFLLIPLLAMQFTDEVNWTLADFVVAGVLLLSTGLLCELVIRKTKNLKHRFAICLGIIVILILIWAELAVGIFGSPLAGN